jgi:transcription elongation GreA/GreB family factor
MPPPSAAVPFALDRCRLKEDPMFDHNNEVILSTNDAATLSAVLATFSPREAPTADAADELAEVLSGARVVTNDALGGDVIGLDAEVTYRELPGGARRTVRLVHPASADASKARISVFAPVGRALLGRRAGARVPVALPNAAIDELHVLSVDRAGRLS